MWVLALPPPSCLNEEQCGSVDGNSALSTAEQAWSLAQGEVTAETVRADAWCGPDTHEAARAAQEHRQPRRAALERHPACSGCSCCKACVVSITRAGLSSGVPCASRLRVQQPAAHEQTKACAEQLPINVRPASTPSPVPGNTRASKTGQHPLPAAHTAAQQH